MYKFCYIKQNNVQLTNSARKQKTGTMICSKSEANSANISKQDNTSGTYAAGIDVRLTNNTENE